MRGSRGFSLLEVLVATLILGLGIVTLVQLSSQGLRLVKLSGDQQEAALLADRLLRTPEPLDDGVETGQEGALRWERRVARRDAPEALLPPNGPSPELRALTVTVRWGTGRSLEVASLRLSAQGPAAGRAVAAEVRR